MPAPQPRDFFMPAEWAQHAATWLAWPCRPAAYSADIAQAKTAYADVINAIAEFEAVNLVVNPPDLSQVKKQISGQVRLIPIAIDDAWLRDSGPTFVKNAKGETAGIDWLFNAWGQKYTPWDKDDAVAGNILQHINCPRLLAPLVLEGGSIHCNGNGTLLTTKQCLLHRNRNPRLSQVDIENILSEYLGVTEFIWLEGDLKDDETDGHIDNIACFADKNTILVMENNNDPTLSANIKILEKTRFNIIKMPDPKVIENGVNLIASYINFYFTNNGIILPKFGTKTDSTATAIMQDLFPHRKIITVDALNIVRGGGGIHCITQQQPS